MKNDDTVAEAMLLGQERAGRELDVPRMSTDGENRSLPASAPHEGTRERDDGEERSWYGDNHRSAAFDAVSKPEETLHGND